MKIAICNPPLESEKGIPLLSQNRQFQWFSDKATAYAIYPVIPASAATLLKSKGYEVAWLDGVAEKWSYSEFEKQLLSFDPDLVMIEAKTPVIKHHWKIIEKIKKKSERLKIVLVGDHVTALPEESFRKSKVDYILTGGDYDFALLNLAEHLEKGKKLDAGVYYRKGKLIKNTGPFKLSHNLDSLPQIDRDLTRWKLYAYKNSNFKHTPGTYIMSGRDCWHGKCSFCFTPDNLVVTDSGLKKINELSVGERVLTHSGVYREIVRRGSRVIDENIIRIKTLNYPRILSVTTNHKFYVRGKEGTLAEKEAVDLTTDDYLAIPVNKDVIDQKFIDTYDILNRYPLLIKTTKRINKEVYLSVFKLLDSGLSQRAVARKMGLNRETVKRYFDLRNESSLRSLKNPLKELSGRLLFHGAKTGSFPKNIPLNKDVCRLIGYYLAEGHVHSLKSRSNSKIIGLTFSKEEKNLIQDVLEISQRYLGVPFNQTLNERNNTIQLAVGNSLMAYVFETLFGDGCLKKQVPNYFMYLPLEKQRELLRGLFRGDGHLRLRSKGPGTEYIYSTCSNKLATQVYLMLLRFSTSPSFRIPKIGKKGKNQAYVVTLSHEDIKKVFPEIALPQRTFTRKRAAFADNFVFVPVVKVTQARYDGKVFNIEVEGEHSYTVGFRAVMNCSWTTLFPGAMWRARSPENVVNEIEHLVEYYKVREIMDDAGTLPVGNWLKDFCNLMIKRGLNKKVRIDCNMRFNAGLDKDDYALMGKAGFRFILYGLESAKQETLDRINKNSKVEQIEPVLTWAKKAGLEPHITIMVGYPWESREDMQATLDMARNLFKKGVVDSMQATIVIPYPGTPLFAECEKKGWLKTENWDRYDMREPIMKAQVSDAELQRMVQSLYASFLTPRFVLRKIREIRSIDDIKFILFSGLKFLAKLKDFKPS